jgi:hypothetical protein
MLGGCRLGDPFSPFAASQTQLEITGKNKIANKNIELQNIQVHIELATGNMVSRK